MFGYFSRSPGIAVSGLLLCSLVYTPEGTQPPLTGVRDKRDEDLVAKLIETVRADAKIPPLTRIQHRDELAQEVCTMAQAGTIGNRKSWARSAYYETSNPELILAELTTIASFNREGPKNSLYYPRYSVAVWQVRVKQSDEVRYFVGVARYASAIEEFIDFHFTDDALYPHDGWKKNIAPQCRGK